MKPNDMTERFLRVAEPRCPGITLAFNESASDTFLENLNPEKKAEIALIMKHLDEQFAAEVATAAEQYGIVHRARLTLEAHGLGSPGLETVANVLPLLSPEDRAVVDQAGELWDE